MRPAVIVASTWSTSQAEALASHLRSQGIAAFTKGNFDRHTYGGEFGGAKVFVDAEHQLEAELEILVLGSPPGEDHVVVSRCQEPAASPPAWIVTAGWMALGTMLLGLLLPVLRVLAAVAAG